MSRLICESWRQNFIYLFFFVFALTGYLALDLSYEESFATLKGVLIRSVGFLRLVQQTL